MQKATERKSIRSIQKKEYTIAVSTVNCPSEEETKKREDRILNIIVPNSIAIAKKRLEQEPYGKSA